MFTDLFGFSKSSIDESLHVTLQSSIESFEHRAATGQDNILFQTMHTFTHPEGRCATYPVEFTTHVDWTILNDIVDQFRQRCIVFGIGELMR